MEKTIFATWIRDIYATYGKAAPSQAVMGAVYRRIETLPVEFLEYATEQLQDRDALPSNLGRELRHVLWPEYLAKNPSLKAHTVSQGCNSCAGSPSPGIIWAEDTGGHRYAFVCVCNSLPSLAHARHWTRDDIEAQGYRLHSFRGNFERQDGGTEEHGYTVTLPSNSIPVGDIQDNQARERVRALSEKEQDEYGKAEAW